MNACQAQPACFTWPAHMCAGDPRRLDDPANRAFLDSMARGECPAELEPPSRSTPVNVNLVRHEREWVPPERPRYTAFSGTGRVLTGACVPLF